MQSNNKLVETLLNKRMLTCVMLGFSFGLPLYLLFQSLPAWLRTESLNLKTIAAFSLITPPRWKANEE